LILETSGDLVSSSATPARRDDWRRAPWLPPLRRATRWVLAALIVGLVIPAATQHWSNVEREQDVKAGLVQNLASSSAFAVTQGGFLLDEPRGPATAQYDTTIAQWRQAAGGVHAELLAYFSNTTNPEKTPIVAAMDAYDSLVRDYVAFCRYRGKNTGRYTDEFRTNENKFRNNVPRATFTAIATPTTRAELQPPTRSDPTFADDTKNVWGEAIIVEGLALSQAIKEDPSDTFNTSWQDYIGRVIWPF
jgi:hypothetical protein